MSRARNIKFRLYRPEDEDAVVALHLEQEEMLGRPMDFPDMLKIPVLETHVAVDEYGAVVGGMYFEAIPEVVFFGIDPAVSKAAMEYAPKILANLKKRGFRMVRLLVPREPKVMAERVDEALRDTGAARTDPEYATYIFDLR